MKYQTQIDELSPKLKSAQQILIVLPVNLNVDQLASGLALYLSLIQSGKQCQIATEGTIRVAHTNLYGVGKVTNTLPQVSGGDLTICLGGVVINGTVPALEKLDWYPDGSNLNLVFHVLPGQKFEPTSINTKHQGGMVDLIFCIGASSLNELGNLYTANLSVFSAPIVNIDCHPVNTNFGQINLVDTQAGSLSEMVQTLISSLQLPVNQDIASNILVGIYEATANLTQNVSPETFLAVAQVMQQGGKIPVAVAKPAVPTPPPASPAQTSQPMPDFARWFSSGGTPPVTPPYTIPATPQATLNTSQPSSPEELPTGESATSVNSETDSPAPDWLTPKIFKGTNLE